MIHHATGSDNPVGPQQGEGADGLVTLPLQCGGRGVTAEVDSPAPVVVLRVNQPPQIVRDDVGTEELSRRPIGKGREVQRPQGLPVGAPGDGDEPISGNEPAELVKQGSGVGMRFMNGVEEPNGEAERNGMRRGVKRGDGVDAVPSCRGQPGMLSDRRVVGGNPMRDPSDESGALQGRDVRIGVQPEGGTPSGIGNGHGEGHPTVGQGNPGKPVANLNRARRGPNLGEDLEGVQGATGLTLTCPQIRLEAPPITSIRIAIRVNGGKHPVAVAAPEQKLEPPPVQHPAMRGQEGGGSLEVNCHTANSAADPLPNLERFGRAVVSASSCAMNRSAWRRLVRVINRALRPCSVRSC
jgi:hypothetical protein